MVVVIVIILLLVAPPLPRPTGSAVRTNYVEDA